MTTYSERELLRQASLDPVGAVVMEDQQAVGADGGNVGAGLEQDRGRAGRGRAGIVVDNDTRGDAQVQRGADLPRRDRDERERSSATDEDLVPVLGERQRCGGVEPRYAAGVDDECGRVQREPIGPRRRDRHRPAAGLDLEVAASATAGLDQQVAVIGEQCEKRVVRTERGSATASVADHDAGVVETTADQELTSAQATEKNAVPAAAAAARDTGGVREAFQVNGHDPGIAAVVEAGAERRQLDGAGAAVRGELEAGPYRIGLVADKDAGAVAPSQNPSAARHRWRPEQ